MKIEVGKQYAPADLPDSGMAHSGGLARLQNGRMGLLLGDTLYEFRMVAECKQVSRVRENGDMDTIDEREE